MGLGKNIILHVEGVTGWSFTNKDTVQPLNIQNSIKIFYGLRGLDHCEGFHVLVGLRGPGVQDERPGGSPGPETMWRIPGGEICIVTLTGD